MLFIDNSVAADMLSMVFCWGEWIDGGSDSIMPVQLNDFYYSSVLSHYLRDFICFSFRWRIFQPRQISSNRLALTTLDKRNAEKKSRMKNSFAICSFVSNENCRKWQSLRHSSVKNTLPLLIGSMLFFAIRSPSCYDSVRFFLLCLSLRAFFFSSVGCWASWLSRPL